ncbi:MAG: MBL fold metallo-hydrolase [Bacteroidales bacterium]|jgi:glyoxylase-like metal-dependent hydrolase (beta-lactamase superfamily II)|nr:MBL fold metallo-hydrolase [Bacteroidales bacterium]
MNKTLKISLWGVAILLILIIIGAAAYLINFLKATKAMTPAETGIINDTVWCIKDKFVNSYIFKGEQGYLMIDAGIGDKNFKMEMDKIGIDPGKITTILLTHTDGDHIGAIGLFKNAAIYMHRNEEQMINGTTGKTKYSKPIWKYGQYMLLNSNDSLTIDGLKIKILYTPGHTPGSSCYLIGNDYLLTGDNLTVTNGEYDHFVEKFNMDTPQQIESLKLLPAPGSFKYILTGHNGAIKID